MRAWLRRIVSWLLRRPRAVSVPIVGCRHDVAPQVRVARLREAAGDPLRLTQIIAAGLGGCEGCLLAALLYAVTGSDQEPADQSWSCIRGTPPVAPQVAVLRTLLAYDGRDPHLLAVTLDHTDDCRHCRNDLIIGLADAALSVMDTDRMQAELLEWELSDETLAKFLDGEAN